MKYVALLRGINPVNAPNATLVTLFRDLGFSDVQTVGSSGNVIFTATSEDVAAIEQTTEEALSHLPGVNGLAIVRSAEQIKRLIDSAPFGKRTHTPTTYLTVTFFKQMPSPDTKWEQNAVAYEPSCTALCTVNDNTVRPPFMTQLERVYGKGITTRTWNAMVKIAHKMNVQKSR